MRVNELAKELGKTSKEVIEILRKNHIEKTHSSNVSDEHIAVVKKAVAGDSPSPAPVSPAPRQQSSPAASTDTPAGAGPALTGGTPAQGEAPKKKITAVYRPQNAQTMRQRPGQGGRDSNRSGSFQGSRDNNRQGGYQGSRDSNRQGGYQGS